MLNVYKLNRYRVMKVYSIMLIFMSFIVISQNIFAEEIYLSEHTQDEYPKGEIKLMLFDNDFNAIEVHRSDISITDNNNSIDIISNNSNNINISKYSITFAVDMAIGFFDSNPSKMDYVKEMIIKLIEKTVIDTTKFCAITSYDYMSYLNHDFTYDLDSLISAVGRIQSSTNSSMMTTLTNEKCASMTIANMTDKDIVLLDNIILLITDGKDTVNISKTIENAKSNNNKIFVVYVDSDPVKSIQQLTEQTNGSLIKINSTKPVEYSAGILKAFVEGKRPYTLIYDIPYACNNFHDLNVSYNNDEIKFNFETEDVNLPSLEISPKYMRFSAVEVGKTKTLEIKITAKDANIFIENMNIIKGDSINISENKLKIVEGKNQQFLLKKGVSHILKIKYSPSNIDTDSALIFTNLIINSNACIGNNIPISAGYPSIEPVGKKTIDITNPFEEKKLFVGDTAQVLWTGLLPEDMVHIAFSSDNGKKWDTTFNIHGYYNDEKSNVAYDWVVENTPSDSSLFRIIQLWPNHFGKTIDLQHNDKVNSAIFSNDNLDTMVVTASDDKLLKVWRSEDGSIKKEFEGHENIVNYAEFNNKNNLVVSASDDKSARLWNMDSDITHSFEHNSPVSCAKFSLDGEYVITSTKGLVSDARLTVWDIHTYKEDKKLYTKPNFVRYFDINSKYPEWILYVLAPGNIAGLWNYETDERITINLKDTLKIGDAFNAIHCDFNAAGDLFVITTDDEDSNISLWAIDKDNTIKFLYSLDTTKTGNANSAYFEYNSNYGQMLLISNSQKETIIWDVVKNEKHQHFKVLESDHSDAVNTSVFNFDSRILLTASSDNTAKLWYRDQNSVQVDTSDYFRIGYQSLYSAGTNLNYAPCKFNKDTLITSFVKNISGGDIKIKKIELEDENNIYSILNDDLINGFPLKDNEEKEIYLRVNPKVTGQKDCKINYYVDTNIPEEIIESEDDADSVFVYDLTVNAYDVELHNNEELLYFGRIELGDVSEIERGAIIENKSPQTIIIDSISINGYSKDEFKIMNTGVDKLPYEIESGQKLTVKIRFVPTTYGRKNAQLVYLHNGIFEQAKVNLYGVGVPAILDSITIAVGDFSGKAGDKIEVPIKAKDLFISKDNDNLDGYTGYLKFNATLLAPEGEFEIDNINGDWRTIKIDLPVLPDEKGILKIITFDVGLGNDTISPLSLERFVPIGLTKIYITEESGVFNLTDYCVNDGTPRLFDPTLQVVLEQNTPNPFAAKTNINYQLAEEGYTKIYITDINGKIVKELLNGVFEKGNYSISINADSLPQGKYFYSLETPTKKLTKSFEITK